MFLNFCQAKENSSLITFHSSLKALPLHGNTYLFILYMKKLSHLLIFFAGFSILAACNDYETYADQKAKERDGISDFISYRNIKVIEESKFHAQGDSTGANEYVYMNNSGVYMQIVCKGSGSAVKDKENANLYVRFMEQSIFDTTTVYTNFYDAYDPDVMNVSRTGNNFTASFTSGLMLNRYSASVPSAWLVPLSYIKVGAPTATENVSQVRLIVPHTQGHTVASSNVYPYFYEITFQKQPGL